MPEPRGSRPWRDPSMTSYGGNRKTSSMLSSRGLCSKGKKCFKKKDHSGVCYPADEEGTADDG